MKSNSKKISSLSPIPEETSQNNSRIKVIVRVRPLTTREAARGHKSIVFGNRTLHDQTLTIWDPVCLDATHHPELSQVDPTCWTRLFSFDRVLWSDPFDGHFSSQETVFEEVGQNVIDWALSGFNCCVLAYGQTGTGMIICF